MQPVLFRIPLPFTGRSLPIFAYGFCLLVGFLLAATVARRRARVRGVNPDAIYDLGVVCLFSGVIGARILFIMIEWRNYAHDFTAIFRVWEGGMVFYGGLVFAAGCGIWYLHRKRLSLPLIAGILAPSLMLGLACGRVGCLLNGCCWGRHAETPISMTFPRLTETCEIRDEHGKAKTVTRVIGSPAYRQHLREGLVGEQDDRSAPVLPTQLMSCAGALLLFGILSVYLKRTDHPGRVFLLMGILYPVVRFTMEALRGDNPSLGEVWPVARYLPLLRSMTLSQNLGLFVLVVSALLWWKTGGGPSFPRAEPGESKDRKPGDKKKSKAQKKKR